MTDKPMTIEEQHIAQKHHRDSLEESLSGITSYHLGEPMTDKPMTAGELRNDLNRILERTRLNRGEKDKTIYDLKESYSAGIHDGIEQAMVYVLEKLNGYHEEEAESE